MKRSNLLLILFLLAVSAIVVLPRVALPRIMRPAIPARLANTDSYFAYPRATLVAESNGGKVSVELSRNFIHPSAYQPAPRFCGGHYLPGGTLVEWQLVRKTEHGDVYLITTQRPGAESVVTPVLFAGAAKTLVATNDLTVRILAHATE